MVFFDINGLDLDHAVALLVTLTSLEAVNMDKDVNPNDLACRCSIVG